LLPEQTTFKQRRDERHRFNSGSVQKTKERNMGEKNAGKGGGGGYFMGYTERSKVEKKNKIRKQKVGGRGRCGP